MSSLFEKFELSDFEKTSTVEKLNETAHSRK